MQSGLLSHVAAANNLTDRWCTAAGTDDFVLSGCGLWPLLGLLATAADEPARSELAAAVGVSADDAQAAALSLLAELTTAQTVSAALGVWVREDLPLREEWVRSLPEGTVERLTDKAALDAWAARHTDGLIDRFPLEITAGTLLTLATAIVARTTWEHPFNDDVLEPGDGPWHGHRGPGLFRSMRGHSGLAVLIGATPVTRVVVRGDSDLDVHLLLGTGTPGEVLRAGFGALDGSVEIRTDLVGTEAPGVRIRSVRAEADLLQIQLPPFEIRTSHDLLADPDRFGLRAATDHSRGRFPALSPTPLCVDSAAQDVLARFTREGFEAAAITAFGLVAASLPRMRDATEIAVSFDRPFGFLAVHRPTGLVIVAGWVARPPGF